MKRSFNFGGNAATQRRRATQSAVAAGVQYLFALAEIEEMCRENEALQSAIADCKKYINENSRLPVSVMFCISIANGITAQKLMVELEREGLCKPGAVARFENMMRNSGVTWQSLTKHVSKG